MVSVRESQTCHLSPKKWLLPRDQVHLFSILHIHSPMQLLREHLLLCRGRALSADSVMDLIPFTFSSRGRGPFCTFRSPSSFFSVLLVLEVFIVWCIGVPRCGSSLVFFSRLEEYLGCVVLGSRDDKICSAPLHTYQQLNLSQLLPQKKIYKWKTHSPRVPAAPRSGPCVWHCVKRCPALLQQFSYPAFTGYLCTGVTASSQQYRELWQNGFLNVTRVGHHAVCRRVCSCPTLAEPWDRQLLIWKGVGLLSSIGSQRLCEF